METLGSVGECAIQSCTFIWLIVSEANDPFLSEEQSRPSSEHRQGCGREHDGPVSVLRPRSSDKGSEDSSKVDDEVQPELCSLEAWIGDGKQATDDDVQTRFEQTVANNQCSQRWPEHPL